jgi:hypothetical protein
MASKFKKNQKVSAVGQPAKVVQVKTVTTYNYLVEFDDGAREWLDQGYVDKPESRDSED